MTATRFDGVNSMTDPNPLLVPSALPFDLPPFAV